MVSWPRIEAIDACETAVVSPGRGSAFAAPHSDSAATQASG